MEDNTKRFYDLTAEQTADEWYENDILMPTILDFLSLLPERPKILDLGCGPGYESMRLASVGAEVIGVDFSPECIRVAKERCPQCRFVLVDFRHLDRSFGEFDPYSLLNCDHRSHGIDVFVVSHLSQLLSEYHGYIVGLQGCDILNLLGSGGDVPRSA